MGMPVVNHDTEMGGVTLKGKYEEDLGRREIEPTDLKGLAASSPLDQGPTQKQTCMNSVGSNEGSLAPKPRHRPHVLNAINPQSAPNVAIETDKETKAHACWNRRARVHGPSQPVGEDVVLAKRTTVYSPSSNAALAVKKIRTEVCSISLALPIRIKAEAVKQPCQSP